MSRYAVFVDAGYLFAAAGSLCCGTKSRASVSCDYKALIQKLSEHCSDSCDSALLRIYWYDAAPNAVPTPEQAKVAALPNAKLRLGRMSGGRQKGVDSLIVRDLMVLARERAMDTAFLLSGDEDLREGVVAAQDMGVRVIVLGIPTHNQAQTLIHESDDHLVLETEFWKPHFTKIIQAPVAIPDLKEIKSVKVSEVPSKTESINPLFPFGQSFADQWVKNAPPEEVSKLYKNRPVIPRILDASLIGEAEKQVGALDNKDEDRKALRKGFWDKIRSVVKTRAAPAKGTASQPAA